MGPRLVRLAAVAVERLGDQAVALENARTAATVLARGRVERLEVEHFLEQHVGERHGPRFVSGVHTPQARPGR